MPCKVNRHVNTGAGAIFALKGGASEHSIERGEEVEDGERMNPQTLATFTHFPFGSGSTRALAGFLALRRLFLAGEKRS